MFRIKKPWILLMGLIVLFSLFSQPVAFAREIPAPEKVLGFKVGADYHLVSYEQAVEYFKVLEKSSSKIKLFEAGETEMGRSMVYAVITSEDNMKALGRYKDIARRLALARGLDNKEAAQMAADGKAVVWIDVGIHASECAPAQHALQLAYDLITSDDKDTRLILDNTILLLVFANPDGMTLVADWYRANLGTPYETSSMPWLYHKYAGHDNNRDSYMNNLKETRAITRLVNHEWFPVIFYDHHQTAPFPARIWIPPAAEPTNPNLHPLFVRGKNLVGSAMGYAFDREEKEGAISRINFDFIYPGYEDSFCDFFNIISIMTETALYRYATPRFYTVNDFPQEYRDFTIGAFYPSPWKGGWWRLRDAVEYCLTASKSVLHTAALYREIMLYSKYKMGKDTIARFKKDPPYAWIIPQSQWDTATAAKLLNKMIFSGLEVYQAETPFVSDGISYPAGTWVIPMSQPFALFAKTLFEDQKYPDLTKYPDLWQGVVRPQELPDTHLPPYDLSGWTLPYQMGVNVTAAFTPLKADLAPVQKAVPQVEEIAGEVKYAYLISTRANNSFTAVNRILREGGEVLRAADSFRVKGKGYPPGTFIVPSKGVSRNLMESLGSSLSLDMAGAGNRIDTKTYPIKTPRVGLYKSWRAGMDEGWTRWILDRFEFSYTNITDAEIRAGELNSRFDVIIIPSQSSNAVIEGHRPGTIPPQYVGGIAQAGVRNIKRFVEQGGNLVTINAGCLFAIDNLGIPVKDALKDVKALSRYGERQGGLTNPQPLKFSCPGSILRMEFDSRHPVAFGMPAEAPGIFYRSTALSVLPSFEEEECRTVAKYSEENLLMSGYLLGEKYLAGKAAAVDVPLGKGRVILLGFAVQNRAQPHVTFKLLFNSLYYSVYRP